MTERGGSRRWLAAGALALVAAVAGAPGVRAQEQKPAGEAKPATDAKPAEEAKGPNTGRISLSTGTDWTTAYFFRGIKQETDDFILQPYGELTFKLLENAGPLTTLALTAGIWNSMHWGPTGLDSTTASAPKVWYELDFYTRLSATLWEDLTAAFIYTAYTSPNNAFGTVQEVALSLGYNDAKLLGPFALNPSVLVAFELDGQADAGRTKGIYGQVGIAPGLTLWEKSAYPLALSVPLAVGLSLKDYYEFGRYGDEVFGYFSGGLSLALPLAFIPADFGKWQLKGGVQVLSLGDNLKAINDGDRTQVIGTLGVALTY